MARAAAAATAELWASRLWAAVRGDRPMEVWRVMSSIEESDGGGSGGGGGGGGARLRELRDVDGFSVLHAAVACGCGEEVLSLLLDAGADPNAPGPGGNTPLHVAFSTGRYSLGDALVAAGADDGRENDAGQSCYELAPEGSAPP